MDLLKTQTPVPVLVGPLKEPVELPLLPIGKFLGREPLVAVHVEAFDQGLQSLTRHVPPETALARGTAPGSHFAQPGSELLAAQTPVTIAVCELHEPLEHASLCLRNLARRDLAVTIAVRPLEKVLAA